MIIKNKKWKRFIYGFSAAFVLLFALDIFPSYYEAATDLVKWFDLRSSKENARDFDTRLKNSNTELTLLKARINSMLTKLSDSQKVSPYIEELNSFAASAKVSLASIKTQNLEKRDNLLVQPLELSLEGNYFQLFEFTKLIESTKRTFVIKNIIIKPGRIDESGITAVIILEIYLNL
jgi:Tfp pilus assembly protein PilO